LRGSVFDVAVGQRDGSPSDGRRILGTGNQWGHTLEYAVQPTPGDLAQTFVIGAEFVRGHPSCLILGDNILNGHGLPEALRRASCRTEGATIYSYWVEKGMPQILLK
jgi:glucose-1-phosphate thymidylyltransferase